MELLDIIDLLDSEGFTRKTVYSTQHPHILSFQKDAPFTIQIDDTTYNETRRVCLTSTDNTINLYINNFTLTNYTKIDIETISTIVISWKKPKKTIVMAAATENGTMETLQNAII